MQAIDEFVLFQEGDMSRGGIPMELNLFGVNTLDLGDMTVVREFLEYWVLT